MVGIRVVNSHKVLSGWGWRGYREPGTFLFFGMPRSDPAGLLRSLGGPRRVVAAVRGQVTSHIGAQIPHTPAEFHVGNAAAPIPVLGERGFAGRHYRR